MGSGATGYDDDGDDDGDGRDDNDAAVTARWAAARRDKTTMVMTMTTGETIMMRHTRQDIMHFLFLIGKKCLTFIHRK